MIEGLIAFILLFVGIFNGNANYLIASALFSIASYLGERNKEDGR